jgi:hypothetical protein
VIGSLSHRAVCRWMRRLMLLLACLCAGSSLAHEMSMAELELRELRHGEFIWNWGAPGKNRPIWQDLTPHWPEGCVAEEQSLVCAAKGLVGSLSIDGVGKAYSAALVRITWLDGQSRVYTLTSAQPSVHLFGAADDRRGLAEIFTAYTLLGIEHILTGVDHLMFVVSLLFLVGFRRQLVGTITAFTLAHSLTLALSVTGWLTLRSAPVEATIALSIVLVAGEALHQRATLARTWPALVAFLFGLVHGLGFAGALKEIGLPQNHLPMALLSFNVGVEIGQLAAVLAAWAVSRSLRSFPGFERGRKPVLYLIGVTAAYWSCLRIANIVA